MLKMMSRKMLRKQPKKSAWTRLKTMSSLALMLLCMAPAFFPLGMRAAAADAPFEQQSWKLDGGFNNPMSTIQSFTDTTTDINRVYLITTIVVTLIFFAVAIPLCYIIWKFRHKPGDDHIPKQIHGNTVLEITWTVVPCILLLIIAVPTWQTIFKWSRVTSEADELTVEVYGHQWWWEFRYPKYNITTGSELHLPENTPIRFLISSKDVLHSFWVPGLAGKVDALPGNVNRLLVTTPPAHKPEEANGDYYQGQCAELCGSSHALMRFSAVVHTKEKFQNWVTTYNQPPHIETASEKAGEASFAVCAACHTIAGTSSDMPGVEKIGPNLSNVGSRRMIAGGTLRNTDENLRRWLRNPPGVKPGALMPNLGLTEDQINGLVAYLHLSTAKSLETSDQKSH